MKTSPILIAGQRSHVGSELEAPLLLVSRCSEKVTMPIAETEKVLSRLLNCKPPSYSRNLPNKICL